MRKNIDPNKITKLCGGCGGGCPSIDENNPDETKFSDDFGGTVRLNDAECRLLCEHLMRRFNLTAPSSIE